SWFLFLALLSPTSLTAASGDSAFVLQPGAPGTNSARVRVTVPEPLATIWFDGQKMSMTGTSRLFHTPSLEPGFTYRYQVKATWVQVGREVTQEQTVRVMAGQKV